MPVPLYLSGVVILFAFPRSKSGIFDLILEKISHSQIPFEVVLFEHHLKLLIDPCAYHTSTHPKAKGHCIIREIHY
jgi:hypothetical protein